VKIIIIKWVFFLILYTACIESIEAQKVYDAVDVSVTVVSGIEVTMQVVKPPDTIDLSKGVEFRAAGNNDILLEYSTEGKNLHKYINLFEKKSDEITITPNYTTDITIKYISY